MSIVISNLCFSYMVGTPYEKQALKNINLTVRDGETLGIIGATGSGKSTLIQHLNGLIPVTSGSIVVDGVDLSVKKPDYKKVRSIVGLVFQYPEYQLFDETVEADVSFGPKNMGLSPDEIKERVASAIEMVGLDYAKVAKRSPFDLSGGQKRRVALAGIIAMRPKILILDEPTAGLDPAGRHEILELIMKLKRECSPTVIIISHNMDEIADMADRIAVMKDGELVCALPPVELFQRDDVVRECNLELPSCVRIAKALRARGVDIPISVRKSVLADDIARLCGGNNA